MSKVLENMTGVPKAPKFISIAPLGDGIYGIMADGRLFERKHDPRNFDGRDKDKWIWYEHKNLPGHVQQAIMSPWHSLIVLLADGRIFERARDGGTLTISYSWKEIELPTS